MAGIMWKGGSWEVLEDVLATTQNDELYNKNNGIPIFQDVNLTWKTTYEYNEIEMLPICPKQMVRKI